MGMPTKNKNKKKNRTNNRQNNNNNKPQKKGAKRTRRPGAGLSQMARLIADPCAGALVHPNYGGSENGYLLRVHTRQTIALPASGLCANGYIAWFPDYTGAGTGSLVGRTPGNCFMFASDDTSDSPVNTTNSPQFASGAKNSPNGSSFPDPDYEWVVGSNVRDSRCVAACMRLTYNGPLNATQGMLGYLPDVTPHQLLDDSLTDGSAAPSIADMLTLSPSVERLGPHTYEVVFRPNESSEMFRTTNMDEKKGVDYTGNFDQNAALIVGQPAVQATTLSDARLGSTPSSIGFVWENMPANDASLVIEMFKVIEWRPREGAGLAQAESRTQGTKNHVKTAISSLDSTIASWDKRLVGVKKDATSLFNLAQTGYGMFKDVTKVASLFL
jgi:hypothetical protein